MSIKSFSADAILAAIADLVDTSSHRYAKSFGPLLADRKAPATKRARAVPLFRAA